MTEAVYLWGMHSPAPSVVNEPIHLARSLPFAIIHLMVLGALFVDVRWQDWAVCAALYFVRMFGITAGYHRYFAHRGFRTGRVVQFLLALLGTTSAQKGVLWWAGHHRHHHVHSDDEHDIHSPKRGFWWSHLGWILAVKHDATPTSRIKDFARFPELRFLNKHWWLPPTLLAAVLLVVGGPSMLFIGFILSTVLLWHATFLVNSLAHVWGSRRFATTDTSRNNALIALLTLGEGWHNNHHHYCSTARQGFYWWEIDVSYYILKGMSKLGLVWDLRTPHADALARNRIDQGAIDLAVPSKARPLELQDAE
ncbi:MAG: acyl-CoA desaturase [Deltaproteobacteria bacterium]|nr:acyl-CoA desaturase [Deltaproteobacteria bacterium]